MSTGSRRRFTVRCALAAAGRARETLAQIGYSVARRYSLGHHAYADFGRPELPEFATLTRHFGSALDWTRGG